MAESELTAERILNSDTYMALVTLSSTSHYRRIVQELAEHDIDLERAPFGDGMGEVAARAVHTLDQITAQVTKRCRFFKRLVGVHRYLMALYLITLLVVSIFIAISHHYQTSLSSSLAWWLVLGNAFGLIGLGAIVQVDKNTLSESDKIDRLQQKKIELINALKQVQSPDPVTTGIPTRVPIRDETGQMILIRHHSLKIE